MILREPTSIRELAGLARERAGRAAGLSSDLQRAQAISVLAWDAPNGWAWRGEVGALVSRFGIESSHLAELAVELEGLACRIQEIIHHADAAEAEAVAIQRAAAAAGEPCPVPVFPHRDIRWVGLGDG